MQYANTVQLPDYLVALGHYVTDLVLTIWLNFNICHGRFSLLDMSVAHLLVDLAAENTSVT